MVARPWLLICGAVGLIALLALSYVAQGPTATPAGVQLMPDAPPNKATVAPPHPPESVASAPLLTYPPQETPSRTRTPGPNSFVFAPTPSPSGPHRVAREVQLWPGPEGASYEWSPDSQSLLYGIANGRTAPGEFITITYSLTDLYKAQLNGSPPQKLLENAAGARWSPDGRLFLFTRFLDYGRRELYLADPDGANPRRLAETDPSPVQWVGAGRIAYARDGLLRYLELATGKEVPAPDLSIHMARGAGERARTFLLSPDGQRLAYAEGHLLWLMDADGGRRVLAADNADPRNLAWAPDGSELAYIGWKYIGDAGGSAPQLWMVNREGTTPLKLVEGGSSEYYWISWFPDSRTLLFTWWLGGGITPIMLVGLEGKDLAYLASPGPSYQAAAIGSGFRPVVSPDGRKVAFERSSQGLWVAFLEPTNRR